MESSEFVSFGRESFSFFEEREWLATNGLGSFASGTVAGHLTRRYHGLLIAALDPPLGRTLLGVKLDEIATCAGKAYPLSTNRWESQALEPEGYKNIESFHLDGTIAVWRFQLGQSLIEKRIWMEPKANTTYVFFQIVEAPVPVQLTLKAIANFRGYHNTTHANGWRLEVSEIAKGLKVNAFQGATPYYILSDRAKATIKNEWYNRYFLSKEQERGLDCVEDHLHAGTFDIVLKKGESATLLFTTESSPQLDGSAALQRRKHYEKELLAKQNKPDWIKQLTLAADAFIVDRPTQGSKNGKTIIAGYHWFGDWGRDTMISLAGLTLTTGRETIAKSILQTFAKFVDQGMLPNRFPDSNQKPEYNTVDATLWYFQAIRAYYEATKDLSLIQELFPILSDIIHWHQKGTRYQIRVDPNDGLLYAGEKGVQLTWMDAKIGDWVVTPRIGKPVEINALWFNALKIMGEFAQLLKQPSDAFDRASQQASDGFQRFWNLEKQLCYDVLDGPDGNDLTIRPNQIFAVSLPYSPISSEYQKSIVETCGQRLFTPRGLRSLDPSDSRYRGRYSGSPSERDAVYHQGTVWAWLLGPYALAHYRVYKNQKESLKILEPMAAHLLDAGLGTCSEIFDADSPFTPRGCIAQAWSVAEILRAWHQLHRI